MVVTKPGRSDEVLDADQQQRITNQIRAQFDSLAPRRPTKPNRSEPDITISNTTPPVVDQNIPELEKLRSLQSQTPVKIPVHGDIVQDEFVETRYYKELGSIDKQHHTTGSGFIRVLREGSEENGYDIQLGSGHGSGDRVEGPIFRSNPATNDWIPRVEEDQVFVSSKPNRSEGL